MDFDPTADPDGDGWTNEQEAVTGTNPFDGNAPIGFLRPEIEHIPAVYITPEVEGGEPEILSPETTTITWPTLAGKQYTLFASTDLSPGSWTTIGTPDIGNGTEMGTAISLTQSDGSIPGKLFLRISVLDVDQDSDTLTNAEEAELGSLPYSADGDNDGLNDLAELFTYLTSPISRDSDGDGVSDPDEILLNFTNPLTATDADGDGIPDDFEKHLARQLLASQPEPAAWGTYHAGLAAGDLDATYDYTDEGVNAAELAEILKDVPLGGPSEGGYFVEPQMRRNAILWAYHKPAVPPQEEFNDGMYWQSEIDSFGSYTQLKQLADFTPLHLLLKIPGVAWGATTIPSLTGWNSISGQHWSDAVSGFLETAEPDGFTKYRGFIRERKFRVIASAADHEPFSEQYLKITSKRDYESWGIGEVLEVEPVSIQIPKGKFFTDWFEFKAAMVDGQDTAVSLLPVELRDIKNLVPDDNDDVTIEPKATVLEQKDKSIAWIEPHGSESTLNAPDMPQLVLRFCGAETIGLKIKWKLAVKYNRPRGTNPNEAQIREQDEVYIPKKAAGQQDQPWKEEALDGAVEIYNHADWNDALVEKGFFGGEAELKYQLLTSAGVAMGTETTMLFSIGGKNPDDPKCKTYIDTNATAADARLTRLSYAVAKHESKDYNGGNSRYNQFWDGYARRFQVNHRKGEPLWCKAPTESSAGGFAVFQITGNLTSQFAIIPREQMWNWQKNADAYIVFVKTGGSASKGSVMDRFFAAVARTYPTDSEAQTPPTSFAYDGGNYDAWEMGTITLYNGAAGCPKSRLRNSAGKTVRLSNPWKYETSKPSGSRWQYHSNGNNYLHEVIQQK